MEQLAAQLAQGLAQALTWDALLFMVFGTLVGYVFGILPGLQSVTAMSVFLPLTYWWTPVQAMYFFAGIIGAAGNGGAVTAIVLNLPGTAQNAATTLEGYPLTRQGRAVFALNLSAAASWLGAVFGVVVLIALVPVFLPFLLAFGPAETFWIAVFGLVTMVLAVSNSPAKGLVAIAIGVTLAIVGLGGPRLPVPRFTFETSYLLDGLEIVVIVIGFLVVSECMLQVAAVWARGAEAARVTNAGIGLPRDWRAQAIEGWRAPFRHKGIFLRSSALGTAVGALPGVGGTVAQFLSYNLAVATTKDSTKIGKGAEDALVATEAATNSKEGGALFPTLLFGIPGNAEMALVLAAWQIHGLEPGPSFMSAHGALAWALVFGLLFSNFVASVGTAAASPWLARLPGFDMGILAPIVLVAALMSAYTVRSNALDLGLLALIGLLGAFFRLYGYSVIGVVIGFVLGDVIERNFYTALQSSLGDYGVFVGSPVAAGLALATLVAALFCGLKVVRAKRDVAEQAAFSPGAAVFAALLLAGLAALLWQTLAPGWRGGAVAQGVLGLAVALQALVLATTLRGLTREGVPEATATVKLGLLLAAALAVAFYAGFVAGMAALLLAFWLGVHRMPPGRALVLATIFAVALPIGFAWLVESPLWRGVVPEVVPGILGGDVAPAL
ncbi:tripartite tricarboxylate transporter permease [Falsiroseomonas oryziterrae]|uniref:tripartite tricarboxylate transporter permease n=1 Tax=Falsiroseomonas oryziterrae TaxID=2911368 RepID=UPI001F2EF382|nr:tripartite tricarboxylate transporter permease [Roseomonas sp. NPKOSM-4]